MTVVKDGGGEEGGQTERGGRGECRGLGQLAGFVLSDWTVPTGVFPSKFCVLFVSDSVFWKKYVTSSLKPHINSNPKLNPPSPPLSLL